MGWEDIPGRHAMGWILDEAVKCTRPNGVWVEVGVALGKGVARMAHVLHEAGRDDVRIYAVDPWAGIARNGEQQENAPPSSHGDWRLFLESMMRHAPDALHRMHILRATSAEASLALRSQLIDLVIIDADHSYSACRSDISYWLPLVREGGVIGGDDHHEVEFPGVGQACREVFGTDYEVRHHELEWPTWMKVKT